MNELIERSRYELLKDENRRMAREIAELRAHIHALENPVRDEDWRTHGSEE